MAWEENHPVDWIPPHHDATNDTAAGTPPMDAHTSMAVDTVDWHANESTGLTEASTWFDPAGQEPSWPPGAWSQHGEETTSQHFELAPSDFAQPFNIIDAALNDLAFQETTHAPDCPPVFHHDDIQPPLDVGDRDHSNPLDVADPSAGRHDVVAAPLWDDNVPSPGAAPDDGPKFETSLHDVHEVPGDATATVFVEETPSFSAFDVLSHFDDHLFFHQDQPQSSVDGAGSPAPEPAIEDVHDGPVHATSEHEQGVPRLVQVVDDGEMQSDWHNATANALSIAVAEHGLTDPHAQMHDAMAEAQLHDGHSENAVVKPIEHAEQSDMDGRVPHVDPSPVWQAEDDLAEQRHEQAAHEHLVAFDRERQALDHQVESHKQMQQQDVADRERAEAQTSFSADDEPVDFDGHNQLQASADLGPDHPSQWPEFEEFHEGLREELGGFLQTEGEKLMSVRSAVREASAAGFIDEKGFGQAGMMATLEHRHAPLVRDELGLTGKDAESAHMIASSFLRGLELPGGRNAIHNPDDGLTVLLPPAVHASLDKSWKDWAAVRCRTDGICSVREMQSILERSIDSAEGIDLRQKSTLKFMIDVELFSLRLQPDDRVRVPGARRKH